MFQISSPIPVGPAFGHFFQIWPYPVPAKIFARFTVGRHVDCLQPKEMKVVMAYHGASDSSYA